MFKYQFSIENLGYFDIKRSQIVNYFWGNEEVVLQLEKDAEIKYGAYFYHHDICFAVYCIK